MSSDGSDSKRKVLVVGWDGADWKVASPLVDAGKMPNLKRLIDTGVMGNISTLYPVLSPMLWTSIATGKRAHKHGIHGFIEPDSRTGGVRPITNLGRKCKAIWNILNQNGKRCNVVGWWPSNPAEPINGVMVSNHFQSARKGAKEGTWPMPPGTIYPPSLKKNLGKFRMHPGEVSPEQILPFVPNAAQVDQTKDKRLNAIAKTLAECTGIHAVATAVMQHEPWDFMGVYYDAIDHFSHGFMKFHPPREHWIPESDFEMYKSVIETAYQFHDLMLGTLMTLAGPDTTIVLLSDHGFHPDHLRPMMVSNEPAGPADEHRQFGMLVINGPGIKQDDLVFGASLLDITPTVLTLFGLPVADDMDGKVLKDVFVDEPVIESIDSWENIDGDDGRHPQDFNIAPVDSHEAIQQLVDLGYVDEPNADKDKAIRETVRELRYNLARDLMDANQLPRAMEAFGELWDEYPDESRFGVKLFNCQISLKDTDAAQATLQRLIKEKQRYSVEAAKAFKALREEQGDADPSELGKEEQRKLMKLRRKSSSNPNAFAFLRGTLLQAQGKFEQAVEVLNQALGVQKHNLPSLRQMLGQCYLGMESIEKARQEFVEVLKIEPANASGFMGLAQCHSLTGRTKKALEAARSATGLVFHNPQAHFLIGHSLLKLGHKNEALQSLTTALAQNPVFPACLRLLEQINRADGKVTKSEEFARLAKQADERLAAFRSGKPLPKDVDLDLDVALESSIGVEESPNVSGKFVEGETIVVVSGLPRSGTSMMMQMLSAGGCDVLADSHRVADESNQRGYFEYEPVKSLRNDASWISQAKGKSIKVISQLVPFLPRDQNYIVIFMTRSLGEIVRSQKAMLERLGKDGAKLTDRKLAATYKRQVEQVRQLASKNSNIIAINVDFKDAIENPEVVAARVNELFGGILDESKMTTAIAPELRNQRGAISLNAPDGNPIQE